MFKLLYVTPHPDSLTPDILLEESPNVLVVNLVRTVAEAITALTDQPDIDAVVLDDLFDVWEGIAQRLDAAAEARFLEDENPDSAENQRIIRWSALSPIVKEDSCEPVISAALKNSTPVLLLTENPVGDLPCWTHLTRIPHNIDKSGFLRVLGEVMRARSKKDEQTDPEAGGKMPE